MKFLDEGEIDEWFSDQKTLLDQRLYKAAYARKNLKKAKARYDKRFAALLKRYEREHAALTARAERQKRLRAPRERLKAWWKAKRHGFHKWRKKRAAAQEKRKIDREYKRMMKK